ncbi:helix-turn-helix domain-containing protein [Alkalihalobacillus sp. CinArs1]|uniref:helix-turn-helix domain-containing protein n=1 Tax=Alkalihalobacillus sp. CinArs1 TaxID=2995314 RepID=UPI0022DDAF54|nr:helix-turn-helix domain-containing protein [Alkalihalobacillus sp. CinArs1]
MIRYLDGLLLFVLHQMKGERTISGAYHLLKGKKSSQTIQDAKLFGLSFLFGMQKNLARGQIEETVSTLYDDGLLEQIDRHTYKVNEKGQDVLNEFLKEHSFPEYLNGWKYHQVSDDFWNRISLYMQALSHSVNSSMNFYPVIREEQAQKWVRTHFPASLEKRKRTAQQLYRELRQVLEALPENHARFFVLRLSGFHRTGLTVEQSCASLDLSYEEGIIVFYGVIHACITHARNDAKSYSIITSFIENKTLPVPLTASTRTTYTMLQKGLSFQQIMEIRRLKKSTIEDHIVEIAINVEAFSIDPFVSKRAQEDILRASRSTNSHRLKTIRDHLENRYGYFEIRLTLCKVGV